jgi:hypothetical protein
MPECDNRASTMRRPRPTWTVDPLKKIPKEVGEISIICQGMKKLP